MNNIKKKNLVTLIQMPSDIGTIYNIEEDKLIFTFKTNQAYLAWCYYYGFPIDDKLLSTINDINE